ncbi:hypothetical protein [Sorangium sp. So ce176]|uniref:hypothetical protein n=1 Tax=Sorangium sp. So ce176 TaxID=3133286 RepID=UPI003F5E300B
MPRRILVLSSLACLAASTLAASPSVAQPVSPAPATSPAPAASSPAGTPPAPPAPAATPPAPGAPQPSATAAPVPPAAGAPAPGAPPGPGGPPPVGAPAAGAVSPAEGAPPADAAAPAAEAAPPAQAAPPAASPGGPDAGRGRAAFDPWIALPDDAFGPPPPPTPAPGEGTLNRANIPLGRRGAIGVETSSFTGGDSDVSGLAVSLFARMPFSGHTFLDVRVPFGLAIDEGTDAVLGNVTFGAHHIVHAGQRLWLTVGGAVGLATLSGQTHDHKSYEPVGASRAYWDLHEYFPSILPIHARLGAEAHFGPLIARAQLEPVLYIPLGRNEEYELAIQHAAEIQIGHSIGGGLRVQGMALPTFDNVGVRHAVARNLYVLALEPFLTIERRLTFIRTGLLLPFDEELGPPLDHTWGFRFSAGIRVD